MAHSASDGAFSVRWRIQRQMAHSASDGTFSVRWRIQRHLTSRPQDCAGHSGPNCNTLCSTQPVQGNREICGWAHSFWFGTLHHPLSLKKLKMYVYFFTNPASSPFKFMGIHGSIELWLCQPGYSAEEEPRIVLIFFYLCWVKGSSGITEGLSIILKIILPN